MKSKRLVVGLCVLAVTSACSVSPEATPTPTTLGEAERQAIADTIRGRMASYAAAVASLKGEAILAHYVASPEFRLFSDGQAFSYSDIQGLVGTLSQVLQASEISWDTVEVTVLDQNAAIAGAPFHRSDTDTGGTTTHVRGAASWVWVRRGGEWLMIHGHGVHVPDTISR